MKDVIKIKIMSENDVNQWDNFVENSGNGTIFHLQRFLNYHPPGKFNNHSIIFHNGKDIIAIIPGVEGKQKNKVFISHPGASFGGFVLKNGINIKKIENIISVFLEYIKKNDFHSVLITQSSLPYQDRFGEEIDFLLSLYGFRIKKKELTSGLFLNFASEEDMLKNFKNSAVRGVKKSLRNNVNFRQSDDIEIFYSILSENLRKFHKTEPTHSYDELKKLMSKFSDRILLFGAYHKGKMIGGIVLFLCRKDIALIFYISSDRRYQALRPENLMLYEMIKWLYERNYKYLDFGTLSVDMKINYGIYQFRRGFGTVNFVRNQYYLKI
ncbi:MAG: GNAT family N-acetyltransferase [Candidatus Helarchaeota archaeon]|nr:GNAT family N-acetyltransferase [Candidatus Helarchaeota archaeon]